MTDLEAMKAAWSQLETRVERIELRAATRPTSRGLHALAARIVVAMIGWAAFVIAVASFWSSHRDNAHLLVAGLSLHAYGVLAIILGAVQLRALRAIDYGTPVLELQQRIAVLIRLRVRISLVLGLPWWFLWLPCLICGLTALLGVDFYDPTWAAVSLLAGAIGLVGSIAIARAVAARTPPGRGIHRRLDALAGQPLLRARRDLADLTRFAVD